MESTQFSSIKSYLGEMTLSQETNSSFLEYYEEKNALWLQSKAVKMDKKEALENINAIKKIYQKRNIPLIYLNDGREAIDPSLGVGFAWGTKTRPLFRGQFIQYKEGDTMKKFVSFVLELYSAIPWQNQKSFVLSSNAEELIEEAKRALDFKAGTKVYEKLKKEKNGKDKIPKELNTDLWILWACANMGVTDTWKQVYKFLKINKADIDITAKSLGNRFKKNILPCTKTGKSAKLLGMVREMYYSGLTLPFIFVDPEDEDNLRETIALSTPET